MNRRYDNKIQEKVSFPPYLYRKLIYEAKNLNPCKAKCSADGVAVLSGLRKDLPLAKQRLNDIIKKLMQEYDADVVTMKKELRDFEDISAEDLDVSKIKFDIASHKPIQIASYQTVLTEDPYVVIPAMAGYYKQPKLPVNLGGGLKAHIASAEDYSVHFPYLIERVLIACQALMKDFSLDNYDFFTDRNNFRKLLSWALGDDQALSRIDFEKYHNCLIMMRYDFEQNNAQSNSAAMYFEHQCFQKEVNETYHTIVEYNFGGKRILMRAEVDGQIEQHTEDFIDDLTSKLSKTNLNEKDMKSYKDSKVKFIVRGEHKDMQFVELKTVMKYRYDNGDLRDEFLSMWFQSYIAGVDRIVIGLKDTPQKKLMVTHILEKNVNNLIETEDFERVTAAICKIIALLNYVDKKMKEGDGIDKASVVYNPKTQALLFSRRFGDSCMPPHYPFEE